MKRLLVKCADFNGHKDVLFMMKPDDFRLTDERFKGDYTTLDKGTYKSRVLTTEKSGAFQVFSDWSVKSI